MRWTELAVRVGPEMVEPVVEVLERYARQRAVVEEPGGFNPDEGEGPPPGGRVVVRVYLPEGPRTRRRRERVEAVMRLLALVQPVEVLEPRSVSPEEWDAAWRSHFRPLRIGRRLVVQPPWEERQGEPGEVVLTLDPGPAFGTGHHPTTRMCLELLEESLLPGMRVLDLGAGSGILSLAALALGAGWALALETDAMAARTARRNLRSGAGGRRHRVVRGTLPVPEAMAMDLALANISARVVKEQAGNLAGCLAPGGVLIASGVLEESGQGVLEALEAAGFAAAEVRRSDDWLAFRCRKRV